MNRKTTTDKALKDILSKELEKQYFRGIKHGSHMQCSTILETYKEQYDSLSGDKVNIENLSKIIDGIFKFCELGKTASLELEKILSNTKGSNTTND